MSDKREVDNNESVFIIVERLVESIRIIAEMQKIGDADQARQYELGKLLLAHLITLAEGINQSLIDFDESAATREHLLVELSEIIVSQQDLLSAEATSVYDREVNMELMDLYADKNATAMFVTRNLLTYGANHEPTVRAFNEKVNLTVVARASKMMDDGRVLELMNALTRDEAALVAKFLVSLFPIRLTDAAKVMKPTRVLELINALRDGIEGAR